MNILPPGALVSRSVIIAKPTKEFAVYTRCVPQVPWVASVYWRITEPILTMIRNRMSRSAPSGRFFR